MKTGADGDANHRRSPAPARAAFLRADLRAALPHAALLRAALLRAALLRALPLGAAALTAAVLLASCTTGSSSSQSTPSIPGIDNTESDLATPSGSDTATASDTTSDSATATDSAPATPTPTRTASTASSTFSPPPGGLSACALPFVQISVAPASGGDSHSGVIIRFRNTGQIECAIGGYPGVAILNAKGQQVEQAARTPSGYLGGVRKGKPTTIALGPGSTASALLEGEVVDVNGDACPAEPGLLITPPNTTTSAKVPARTMLCGGTQIHPVVSGTSGSSG